MSLLGSSCGSASVVDLQTFDWSTVTMPGDVCGAAGPIHLHGHEAFNVRSSRWPAIPLVWVSGGGGLVYGDVTGDGHADAAFQASCNVPKSAAAGQLAFAVVVYKASSHGPTAIGVLRPQHPSSPDSHVPLDRPVALRRGRVVVSEAFYGPRDGTCCPTGRATTTWTFSNGKFRAIKTTVTQRARR
jgi:hypothetical protein